MNEYEYKFYSQKTYYTNTNINIILDTLGYYSQKTYYTNTNMNNILDTVVHKYE